jgi:hypothetical protein
VYCGPGERAHALQWGRNGHAVEADLRLEKDLDGAIDAALAGRENGKDRRAYRMQWRSELFADLYGCLGAGPAFTRAA